MGAVLHYGQQGGIRQAAESYGFSPFVLVIAFTSILQYQDTVHIFALLTFCSSRALLRYFYFTIHKKESGTQYRTLFHYVRNC